MYYSSGNYEAFARPVKPEGVDRKSAYIVGSGLGALAAACFLVRDGQMKGKNVHIKAIDWALMISGVAVILYSFIRDYVAFLMSEGLPVNIWALANDPDFQQIISKFVPTHYNWYLFFAGEVSIILGMTLTFRRAHQTIASSIL